ncbi:unnamed protein product [Prorocentrum cordatum]|uniref:Uncharacterized protein n=1 Tax=Prorocentrum cordatum TaxID=2364126 RepID=A0ABN9SIU4_9DINO|nr:unnamed protein product [Polarella glacialis]
MPKTVLEEGKTAQAESGTTRTCRADVSASRPGGQHARKNGRVPGDSPEGQQRGVALNPRAVLVTLRPLAPGRQPYADTSSSFCAAAESCAAWSTAAWLAPTSSVRRPSSTRSPSVTSEMMEEVPADARDRTSHSTKEVHRSRTAQPFAAFFFLCCGADMASASVMP